MSQMVRKSDDGDNICANCVFGTLIFTGDEVLCRRHGLVRAAASCRRFRADPLKRRVMPAPALPRLDPSDEL